MVQGTLFKLVLAFCLVHITEFVLPSLQKMVSCFYHIFFSDYLFYCLFSLTFYLEITRTDTKIERILGNMSSWLFFLLYLPYLYRFILGFVLMVYKCIYYIFSISVYYIFTCVPSYVYAVKNRLQAGCPL